MSHFKRSVEFEKELAKLIKKYRSISEDLADLEKVLMVTPVGLGINFTTLHHAESLRIVKARLACKSLRKRSMRVIYAYHNNTCTFLYIEIYYKSNKPNEDVQRWRKYVTENTEE
jgi:hypothetical protein